MLRVVCCVPLVGCLLRDICRSLIAVCWRCAVCQFTVVDGCVLFVVRQLLFVVLCSVFAVCGALLVGRCSLAVGG